MKSIGPSPEAPPVPLIPVPLTSYPGIEATPDFSPDGNQVVFAWTGEDQDNLDIYVKMIGPGAPLRLTSDPGADWHPAWAPDGRWIAFVRDGTEIILVPPLGGPERKLADVDMAGRWGIAWSPDSKWIVTPHRESAESSRGLFLITVETGEQRRLTSAVSPLWDFHPAFSPDGWRLAFVRGTEFLGEVHLLELGEDLVPRAEPKPLTDPVHSVSSPAWSANGRAVIYTSSSNALEGRLWRIDASGGGGAELLEFAGAASTAKVSR
ncbi:MAG: hypothetical protein GY953_41335, partial [bacterium]|nr:hypothetical protein [bacterium]